MIDKNGMKLITSIFFTNMGKLFDQSVGEKTSILIIHTQNHFNHHQYEKIEQKLLKMFQRC